MKGIVLILLTILVALYMINECEGGRRRKYRYWRRGDRYWRRGVTIQERSKSSTLNTEDKREMLNDDVQDEDIVNEDSEDEHLDERFVDMNNEGVKDDIDERDVNEPQEDD
uniref:Myticalin C1 n=1 Tax=Mytilus galloprovincialis TaxID=29158 RepID=A0A286RMV1_MYTGA|nr:myticalin C1 [Mytilus galloprovincialis]